MKKIDFKKPRYALPIICLPFLILFFYVYKSSFGKEKGIEVGRDSLQTDVANVSQQVKNQELSGKLDAFRNKFKQADGYTAIGTINEENQSPAEISSAYNLREKRMLDSVDQVMKKKYNLTSSKEDAVLRSTSLRNSNRSQQDLALASALSKINRQENRIDKAAENANTLPDQMQLFRAQMALVDSIGKANDPVLKEKMEKERVLKSVEAETKDKKSVPVKRWSGPSAAFNTIVSGDVERPISAVIDQDITGFSGSRLRIRLTDDIMAGKMLIRKGTYLYATISGFSAQRVSLLISSVFYGGEILPINLQVYDNDGLAGIYVPSSAFREFTRDMSSSGTQGITIQQIAENNNQLVMGVLSKMFQSTTTAVNKLIRSNKVKVKYNTQVYLIDPAELKRKQQSY